MRTRTQLTNKTNKVMRKLYVLIACEESQAECFAFRELGHIAYSCDIQPCRKGGNPYWHIQGDVTPQNTSWKTRDRHGQLPAPRPPSPGGNPPSTPHHAERSPLPLLIKGQPQPHHHPRGGNPPVSPPPKFARPRSPQKAIIADIIG